MRYSKPSQAPTYTTWSCHKESDKKKKATKNSSMEEKLIIMLFHISESLATIPFVTSKNLSILTKKTLLYE